MIEVALVFLIGKGIFELCKYIMRNNEDELAKLNNKSSNGLTYVDSTGRMRLVSNNHIVMFEKYNGCDILRDIKTNHIVKNFTQDKKYEEYKKSKEKAIQEGKTIFCIDFGYHKDDKIRGMRYMDINTQEKFVIRVLGKWKIPFYMNMEGEIVKPVDPKWKPLGWKEDISGKFDIKKEYNNWLRIIKQSYVTDCYHNFEWSEWADLEYCGKRC